jgi:hypothetical protein
MRLSTDGKVLGSIHVRDGITGVARLRKDGIPHGVIVTSPCGVLHLDPDWRLAGVLRDGAQGAVTVTRGTDSLAMVALDSGDVLLLRP